MAKHGVAGLLVTTLVFVHVACDKKQAPAPESAPDISRQLVQQPTQPILILDKTFELRTSAAFPFEIPAHSARPHLHGVFESHLGSTRGVSDDAANIDLVVMNEDQQSELANSRPSEALFSVEDSHSQSVNFDLPPSFGKAVKYYLVFENPRNSKAGKQIKANFRIDF
jgi:hypothetical protein